MVSDPAARIVYHVSPWRRHVSWVIFGPMILLFLGLALIDPASPFMWVAAGFFALISISLSLLIRTARLEISPEGVRLAQVGYILETSWPNVIAVRLAPGTEGLVTSEALTGKGVARLAGVSGFGMRGVPLYDEERQALLAQHRFIPIEAFAWHLRKGRQLRTDIIRFAPQLKGEFDASDTVVTDPSKDIKPLKVAAILICLLLLGTALALCPPSWQDSALLSISRIVLPLLSIRAAYSTWNAFRAKASFLGTLFLLLTVVLLLWSVELWRN